jgi:hypothetical protein
MSFRGFTADPHAGAKTPGDRKDASMPDLGAVRGEKERKTGGRN